jgi:hypothetical protein
LVHTGEKEIGEYREKYLFSNLFFTQDQIKEEQEIEREKQL